MAGWQMKALGMFFRVAYKRRYATAAAGLQRLDQPKSPYDPPARVTSGRAVERREVAGFPVVVVSPRHGRPPGNRAVVYLHGGAYTNQIVKQHWQLVAHLADRTGCDVHVPIYPLAPQHTAAEAMAFVQAVLDELADEGRRLHLVGDSSGGGLALLAAQQISAATRPSLVGVTAIAPWLDMAMSNPAIDAVEAVDPWLTRAGLRPIADAWVGDVPLDDPRVSPVRGPVDDLPPVGLWVGTRDITMPDCRLLRDRLSGATVTYVELEGGLHVYPLLPVPEGRRARDHVAQYVTHSLR